MINTAIALSSRLSLTPSLVSKSRAGSNGTGAARRGQLQVIAAKKNKRKEERKAQKRAETKALLEKRDANKEEEPADAPVSSGPKPYEATATVMQSLTICGSYKDKTGDKLLDGTILVQEAAETLWNAPFVCASHDASDVFNYGNKAALSLWQLSWDEFVGLPSTKSAEDDQTVQSERRELLDRAAKDGYIKDYSGIRQTSDGRKFKINGATVWTITDKDGNKTGQAVRFDTFSWVGDDGEEEEMMVCEGGEIVSKKSIAADAASDPKDVPSEAEVAEASAAVEAQAAEVRRLKEEDGLDNSSPEIQAGVASLMEKKAVLADLEERIAAAADA